ncbi:MAG: SufE family protein [Bacteroides sp.]|nr:MAG: SufE family protein [Bacteroides sp.]
MNNINIIQDNIIKDFEIFQNDLESIIYYIIDLGRNIPLMDKKYKIERNLIKGCQSNVWLISSLLNEDKIFYYADSNNMITKGLISLLLKIFNNQSYKDIINSNVYFIDKIGMSYVIGSQRINGIYSMIKTIKYYAMLHSIEKKYEKK